MPVGRRFPVDGAAQVEVANDCTGPQIEYLVDHVRDFFVRNRTGAEGFDVDAQRMGNADGIRHLNFTSFGQPRRYDIFCRPACRVGC